MKHSNLFYKYVNFLRFEIVRELQPEVSFSPQLLQVTYLLNTLWNKQTNIFY